MNNTKTINREPRRLYQVCFCYHDAGLTYREHSYFMATRKQLEEKVRQELREFADDGGRITWTYENQYARKGESGVEGYPPEYLEVTARTIESLGDLDICWLARDPLFPHEG